MKPTQLFNEPFVLYTGKVGGLSISLCGVDIDLTDLLANGRSSYTIFQRLVEISSGFHANSEGGKSDLESSSGKLYEVKAFKDSVAYPMEKDVEFHTAASSTFSPNNRGPEIKNLLKSGKYDEALEICKESGYNKNDYYVYTNTSQFCVGTDLKFIILPKDFVVANLSKTDPRLISRDVVLKAAKKVVPISLAGAVKCVACGSSKVASAESLFEVSDLLN